MSDKRAEILIRIDNTTGEVEYTVPEGMSEEEYLRKLELVLAKFKDMNNK